VKIAGGQKHQFIFFKVQQCRVVVTLLPHYPLPRFFVSIDFYAIFSLIHARVAQWIRAFASGAKGRRFDPCRGYHFLRSICPFVCPGSCFGSTVQPKIRLESRHPLLYIRRRKMRRRARITQIVCDFSRKPLSESRVLDLACLEGHSSAEMALRGAQVLAIEGRRSNLERAQALFPAAEH
jgi:hypothetical protein